MSANQDFDQTDGDAESYDYLEEEAYYAEQETYHQEQEALEAAMLDEQNEVDLAYDTTWDYADRRLG